MNNVPDGVLDDLLKLSAAAHDEPWYVGGIANENTVLWEGMEPDHETGFPGLCPVLPCYSYPNDNPPTEQESASLQLIASMRNNIDGLIAALRAARANERRYLWLRVRDVAIYETILPDSEANGRLLDNICDSGIAKAALDAAGGNDG